MFCPKNLCSIIINPPEEDSEAKGDMSVHVAKVLRSSRQNPGGGLPTQCLVFLGLG